MMIRIKDDNYENGEDGDDDDDENGEDDDVLVINTVWNIPSQLVSNSRGSPS